MFERVETRKMKILITGSDGFIAKNFIMELKNRKYKELLLVNRRTSEELLGKYALECDAVVHLAGVNRPKQEEEYYFGNVMFTKKLINYLSKNTKKLHIIFASSIQAGKENPYGISKQEAEELFYNFALNRDVDLSIYRLPNVFGKWCRPNYNSVVATFCYNIARGKEIRIDDPSAEIELIYIDDVIRAWIGELEGQSKKGETYGKLKGSVFLTVGELANMLFSFSEYHRNLSVPNFTNLLEKNLYSTYTSYLETEQLKYGLEMHQDNRGAFTEFLKAEESGQVSINITKPGITKGNHWHHTKTEKFMVVRGQASIKMRHMITNEKMEFIVSGEKLEVVDIPVGYTHNITNIGKEDLITVMWANEIFDKENPDTYYEEV